MQIKLSENIRRFRKERKMTQEQLAESRRATDEAIAKIDKVNAFLCQVLAERPAYDETIRRLKEAVA